MFFFSTETFFKYKEAKFAVVGLVFLLIYLYGSAFLVNFVNLQHLKVVIKFARAQNISSWESVLVDGHSFKPFFKSSFASPDQHPQMSIFFAGAINELEGDHQEAVEIWRQIPDVSRFFLSIGTNVLYNDEDPALAIKYLSLATAIDPSKCDPYYHLGLAWIQLDFPDKALSALSGADTLVCDQYFRGEIYYQRGKLLADAGQIDSAVNELSKSLQLDDDDAKRLVLLGELLSKVGKYDEAYSLLSKAVTIAPENVWTYISLCEFERRRGKLEGALQWCRTAVEALPDNPTANHYLGLIYLEIEDEREAIKWFEKAISFDAQNANTWNRLGDAYRKVGDIDLSLESYQSALKIDPDNAYSMQRLEELTEK